MATSTDDRILAAFPKSQELLQTLSQTEYAASELPQAQSYLKDCTQEIQVRRSNLLGLKRSLEKEQKEHESYRDSTMKRLAFKVSGKKEKFASKQEKEEREYLEAVQKHFDAQQQMDHLKVSAEQTSKRIEELKGIVSVHEKAQGELDRLYDSIFKGPTPEYPEEDKFEQSVEPLRQEYAQAQGRYSAETQVIGILQDAQKFMARALQDMASARDSSNMDIWGVGGPFADMSERSSLSSAQSHASQVEMLLSQAQRLQPAVKNIGRMQIAQGNVMSDIIFDNIFSDMAFHDKIKASQVDVNNFAVRLNGEVQAAKQRQAMAKGELDRAANDLGQARKELERVRTETFEKVASGLPPYSA